MYSHYAFVSESGNYILDFNDEVATNYFIVTAILIKSDQMLHIEKKLNEFLIIERNNIEEAIKQLLPLNFQVYSVVINKKKLRYEGGHGNLKSSFDFINDMIYHDLFVKHIDIQVLANEQTEFLKSFETFINDRHQPDLFNHSAFVYDTQIDNGFIRLSNIISQSIFAKYEYDQTTINELSKKFIRLIKHPTFDFNLHIDNKLDNIIAEQAILIAQNFIKRHGSSEKQINVERVNFLKFLLTQLSIRPNKYIYSQEVIDNMKTFSAEAISREYLMSDIIGPLRDSGVLIASTSKGYKIPTAVEELIDYAEFGSSMALPILRRIKKSRERVLGITNNELDILEGENFKELRNFFG